MYFLYLNPLDLNLRNTSNALNFFIPKNESCRFGIGQQISSVNKLKWNMNIS